MPLLVSQRITDLPQAPSFFALARFRYEPGALFGPAAGPGPVCMHVESGRLEFSATGPLLLTKAGTEAAKPLPPGETAVVGPLDQLVVPGGVVHSARTVGTEAASMVGVASFPAAPPQEFPPGVSFQPLALGLVERLPGEPVEILLRRRRLDSGATTGSPPRGGPSLVHVEDGELAVTLAGGDGTVARAETPQGPPEPMPRHRPVVLRPGDSCVLQQDAAPTARTAGAAPAVFLEATAAPDKESRRDLVRRYFYDAWHAGKSGEVARLLARDFVDHTPLPGQLPGVAGVEQAFACWRAGFPEFSVSIDAQLAEGQTVATRYTFRGTHRATFMGVAATGARVQISGIDLHTVTAGRITERWGYLDLLGLADQLGLSSRPPG